MNLRLSPLFATLAVLLAAAFAPSASAIAGDVCKEGAEVDVNCGCESPGLVVSCGTLHVACALGHGVVTVDAASMDQNAVWTLTLTSGGSTDTLGDNGAVYANVYTLDWPGALGFGDQLHAKLSVNGRTLVTAVIACVG